MVALPEPRHIRRCILTAWLLSRATSIMHRLFIYLFISSGLRYILLLLYY